jgi:hypothetical protein
MFVASIRMVRPILVPNRKYHSWHFYRQLLQVHLQTHSRPYPMAPCSTDGPTAGPQGALSEPQIELAFIVAPMSWFAVIIQIVTSSMPHGSGYRDYDQTALSME